MKEFELLKILNDFRHNSYILVKSGEIIPIILSILNIKNDKIIGRNETNLIYEQPK